MAQLVVRQLEEEVVARLRERAAEDGVSIEEEHRRILRRALIPAERPSNFREHLLSIPVSLEEEEGRRQRTTRVPSAPW